MYKDKKMRVQIIKETKSIKDENYNNNNFPIDSNNKIKNE